MISCCRAAPAAPAPAVTGRDARPVPVVGGNKKTTQHDAALYAFDRLRIREVEAEDEETAATFLAKFQSAAASLELDERIKLMVYMHESMERLKAVLADPQANKICSLFWVYDGDEDVEYMIPLLLSKCPELASLRVYFVGRFAFDFASSVLEHPGNHLKVLEMPNYTKGDLPRFFAALGQSQVSVLTISSDRTPEFVPELCKYLVKDLLVSLGVSMRYEQVPPELMVSMASCTRLVELTLTECKFSEPIAFPKSIAMLALHSCQFFDGFDCLFLSDSNVRELDFFNVIEVKGSRLRSALVACIREKGLDTLRLRRCNFVNETLAAVGVEIGRVKRLEIHGDLKYASVELIALALQSPSSEMKELKLEYNVFMVSRIRHILEPALRRPNCSLTELGFWAGQEHRAAAKTAEDTFRNRRALFVLLQGQQVRRRYCPLRRLPVELLRLVGEVLL